MKPLKFWQKTLLVTVEAIMVLGVLALLGGGVLLWQLNQGPIEVGFAKKYIESELSDPVHSLSMHVGQVYLAWSKVDSRPLISLKQAKLVNTRTKQTVISVESVGVTVSRQALMLGRILPRTIVIENPLITLIRKTDHGISLALEQSDSPADETQKMSAEEQSTYLFSLLEGLSQPEGKMTKGWLARSLQMIVIDGARIMVEDHILQRSWLVPRADLAFHREDGRLLSGASLWIDDANQADDPAIKIEAAYIRSSHNIVADLTINNLSAPFLASRFPDLSWLQDQGVILSGRAQATLGEGLNLQGFEATLESNAGHIIVPDVYDQPLSYQRLVLNMVYDGQSRILTMKDSPLRFTDDFSVTISGQAKPESATGSYDVPLKILVHSLPQSRLAEFWPGVLKGEPAEDWALHRLSAGHVFDSVIDINLKAARQDGSWGVVLEDLKTKFNIADMTVDYRAPLMPVTKASGQGVYDYKTDKMEISIDSGMLGDLKIESGKVAIDVVAGAAIGEVRIDAQLSGPVKTVFKYINAEPISAAKNAVSDIEKIEGVAALTVNVSFPTLADLPAEKVNVTVNGTADKLLLPGLVHGLDVSGGPVKLSVKDGKIDASGQGRIDGRNMNFVYAQFFESKGHDYSMRVNADLMVDTGLREKFGVDLSDWMEGSVPTKVVYTDFGGGRAEIDAKVDATPASLLVKPMGYTKNPGLPAEASAKAILDHGFLRSVQNLNIKTPDARLDGGTLYFEQIANEATLTSGTLPRTRLYETDVAVKFKISQQNIIDMSIEGPFFDVRPLLEKNKNTNDYTGPGLRANVNVVRMRTAEARLIEQARAVLDMDKKGDLNRLELNAVAGKGAMSFIYKPDQANTRMILRIEADDAGAALQAFSVYENTRGGKLLVAGSSAVGGDRKVISGSAELTDFRLINAPVLARLVNSLSLPGILSLLGSDGIDFTRLEAAFTWEKKKGVDMITVRDGKTSGASMGLTFDGTLDRFKDLINITGTIVPASMLNSMLSSIPIVGDILTGGSGGAVFAATYSVRGPAKEPTTTVNPLAILAPGFLRQIFFE